MMRPVEKKDSSKKHWTARRTVAVFSALLIATAIFGAVYFWSLDTRESPGFQDFKDHYLGIMKNLNSSKTKLTIASDLEDVHNFTDVFAWEHTKLAFGSDPNGWFKDPSQILREGEGVCSQFSIVFVCACLSLGVESRLVVAVNTTTWVFIHIWAEIYHNGSWIHVDPSDQVWNQPLRYQSWDWGEHIGADVRIYAFQDGKAEDVTSVYS